jgi:hypothetical protein
MLCSSSTRSVRRFAFRYRTDAAASPDGSQMAAVSAADNQFVCSTTAAFGCANRRSSRSCKLGATASQEMLPSSMATPASCARTSAAEAAAAASPALNKVSPSASAAAKP